MAKSVGKISVDLEAKVARFQRDLSKATRSVRGFKRKNDLLAASIKKAAAAAIAFFGARALGGYVKRTLQAIDATAKLADRVGESTENLIKLQHAAEITGAGSGKLAAGMDVLQKRLGEAAIGMGEGAAALDVLGLSVDALLKMSPADQFKAIADATSQLSSKATQAAVTAKLFSRANQDLVNTLALGRKGLEEMGAEAEELGITFSRDAAAQVEAANDAMTRLKGAAQGLGNALTIALAPALEKVAEVTVVAAKFWNQFATDVFSRAPELAEDGLEALALLERMNKQFKEGAITQAQFDARAKTLVATVKRFREEAERIPKDILSGGEGDDRRDVKPDEALRKRAEKLLEGLKSEEEQLRLSMERQEAILESATKEGLIDRAEGLAAAKSLLEGHKADLKAIEDRAEAEDRRRLNRKAAMQRQATKNIAAALVSLTSIGANESRKQFELNKKASIAEALVSTAAGIARGFRELPPIAAWANAAAVGAAGAAQIAAIKSTTFEGGGSVGAGAAAAPATAAAPPTQVIEVAFSGRGEPTRGDIVGIMEGIGKAVGDGVELIATGLTA